MASGGFMEGGILVEEDPIEKDWVSIGVLDCPESGSDALGKGKLQAKSTRLSEALCGHFVGTLWTERIRHATLTSVEIWQELDTQSKGVIVGLELAMSNM